MLAYCLLKFEVPMMKKGTHDLTCIKEIAQIMDAHGLSKVNIIYPDVFEVFLQKNTSSTIARDINAATHPCDNIDPAETIIATNLEDVKSPIVGVFYASSSPEAGPFVRIGDTVKKGDVLCVLEAMKLMNEIQAEQEGKIIDICVKNGDLVEFGQTMFKLDVT